MPNGLKRKLSKRMSCKKRYKIEKKVRQHNKKQKKIARKSGNKPRKFKDPGIPSCLPFRDEIIAECQEIRKEESERKAILKEELKLRQQTARDEILNKKRGITLEGLSVDENDKSRITIVSENIDLIKEKLSNLPNLKSFHREFNKVIEASDVIIEVLDARDPLGTRCPQVEEAIYKLGPSKKLILLLNKVDLIPRENLVEWLKYLRNELPTIAFKASTQSQKSNIGRISGDILSANQSMLSSSKCLGASTLMKLLGNYCRNQDVKTSITVGIVGFPNVGKSSVINSLKRNRSCVVGGVPGVTRMKQEIVLDKHIRLLDCPGVVFAKPGADAQETAALVLRNAITLEQVTDHVTPVESILSKVKKEDIQLFYRVPDFSNSSEFLALLAKRFGKLKKGGFPNVFAAAKKVLQDWNFGRIKYFTTPPDKYTVSSHFSAEIIKELSKGFNIDEKFNEEEMEAIETGIPKKVRPEYACNLTSSGFTSCLAINDENTEQTKEENVMDTEQLLNEKTKITFKKKKEKKSIRLTEQDMNEEKNLMKGKQLNRDIQKQLKKSKKKERKLANRSMKSSMDVEPDDKSNDGDAKDDNYNFDSHF